MRHYLLVRTCVSEALIESESGQLLITRYQSEVVKTKERYQTRTARARVDSPGFCFTFFCAPFGFSSMWALSLAELGAVVNAGIMPTPEY